MREDLDGKLADYYFGILPTCIDEEGFRNPPLLGLTHDGNLEYVAPLDLSPEQIFDFAHLKLIGDKRFKEVCFALDRVTKPGQGTKYADCLTIFWWYGPHPTNSGFRMGVVNYKPTEPVVIEPIDWENEFWTEAMHKELANYAVAQIQKLKRRGVPEDMIADLLKMMER